MTKKLFPEFLNKDSKGPAVAFLQTRLFYGGYNPNIVIDGDYGDETAKGVMSLQRDLGVEVDGHYGPATRKADLEAMGVNVNELEGDLFEGETVCAPL